MKRFNIVIAAEKMDKIKKSFYKKEALADVLATTSTEINSAVNQLLVDNYNEAYAEWKSNMDAIEFHILKDIYQSFVYNYSMRFITNEIILETPDENMSLKLISLGFKEV